MEFTSITFLVLASDEKESLIKTVEILSGMCPGGELEKILLIIPRKITPEFDATVTFLENKYPGLVERLVQTLPYIGGAVRDGGNSVATSHFMLFTGDLAIGFESLPEMIECAKKHPEAVVKTSRWMEKKGSFEKDYSRSRRLINGMAQVFLRVLYLSPVKDLTNPGQIMPAELFRSINWQELKFPFMEEMVLVPVRLRVPVYEFPAKCYGRKEGVSKNSFLQTAMYLKTAVRVRFTPKKKLLLKSSAE